jgi:hypothetical protein
VLYLSAGKEGDEWEADRIPGKPVKEHFPGKQVVVKEDRNV